MKSIPSERTERSLVRLFAPAAIALFSLTLAGAAAADNNERATKEHKDAAHQHVNLRAGAVYSMSNARTGNEVVAFSRAPDGTLTPAGRFSTGGTGSGGFEDTANGLVLGSAESESSPNNFTGDAGLLYATNAGSDTISVFRVAHDGLRLVEVQGSGGQKPVSVTVHDNVLYVLNSGETLDGLVPPNCSVLSDPAKQPASITGFRVSETGQLDPIPGSTRTLSGDPDSGCAQVSFNPAGTVLVVTERMAQIAGQTGDDEGVINTFEVNIDGTLGRQRLYNATGEGPFGFTFNKQGALLTTEQFDGLAGPGEGAAAGYSLADDGTLTATSPSVGNGGTDSCWFVVTDNGHYGYVTSFFGTGRISSYLVGENGSLELLDGQAADAEVNPGASDLALSRSSRYLYQLNSFDGTISAFAVGSDGSLTFIQKVAAHAPSAMAAPLGLAAS